MAAYSKPRGMLPMLFAIIFFIQAAAALHGQHSHHVHRSPEAMRENLEETKKMLAERANNVQITGVPTGQSSVSSRLEIRQLKKNADQWNLYLLGMERFMAKSKSDRLGYYQVAGV